ncbi:MAG: diiron oxygenase [Pseudomonadota bacterium]
MFDQPRAVEAELIRMVRRGPDEVTVSSLVYRMCALHIADEARHIAHARAMCAATSRAMAPWRRRLLSPALDFAFRQFVRYLYYPAAAIYGAAGLDQPEAWRARHSQSAPARMDRRGGAPDPAVPALSGLAHRRWFRSPGGPAPCATGRRSGKRAY